MKNAFDDLSLTREDMAALVAIREQRIADLEASLREMVGAYEATADSAPHRYEILRQARQILRKQKS